MRSDHLQRNVNVNSPSETSVPKVCREHKNISNILARNIHKANYDGPVAKMSLLSATGKYNS
jgi:hypothetical protein